MLKRADERRPEQPIILQESIGGQAKSGRKRVIGCRLQRSQPPAQNALPCLHWRISSRTVMDGIVTSMGGVEN